jgi:hypothetical protein
MKPIGGTKKAEALSCKAESTENAKLSEPVDLLLIGRAAHATYNHGCHPRKEEIEKAKGLPGNCFPDLPAT